MSEAVMIAVGGGVAEWHILVFLVAKEPNPRCPFPGGTVARHLWGEDWWGRSLTSTTLVSITEDWIAQPKTKERTGRMPHVLCLRFCCYTVLANNALYYTSVRLPPLKYPSFTFCVLCYCSCKKGLSFLQWNIIYAWLCAKVCRYVGLCMLVVMTIPIVILSIIVVVKCRGESSFSKFNSEEEYPGSPPHLKSAL